MTEPCQPPSAQQMMATVVANQACGPGIHLLELTCAAALPAIAPGQFAFLRPRHGDIFLRRPLGVHEAEGTRLRLLFDVVGRGTAALAAVQPGQELDLLLPLGHPFEIPPPPALPVLVAGGLGLPPLHFLARQLHAAQRPFRMLYGARTAARLVLADDLAALCPQLRLFTDDGSAGEHAQITAGLADLPPQAHLLVCGPTPMMRAVASAAAQAGLACQVSLEERMACGLGVCMGCVCRTRNADGQEGRARVCVEGPVFPAQEVLWDSP